MPSGATGSGCCRALQGAAHGRTGADRDGRTAGRGLQPGSARAAVTQSQQRHPHLEYYPLRVAAPKRPSPSGTTTTWRTGPDLKAKTVGQSLRDRGILLQDPDLHRDLDPTWIETTVAALPEVLADEVGQWVKVLRSRGRHEGEVRGYDANRPYLASLQPVLTTWAEAGVLSLREVAAARRRGRGRLCRTCPQAARPRPTQLVQNTEAGTGGLPRPRPAPSRREPDRHPEARPQRPAGQRLAAAKARSGVWSSSCPQSMPCPSTNSARS